MQGWGLRLGHCHRLSLSRARSQGGHGEARLSRPRGPSVSGTRPFEQVPGCLQAGDWSIDQPPWPLRLGLSLLQRVGILDKRCFSLFRLLEQNAVALGGFQRTEVGFSRSGHQHGQVRGQTLVQTADCQLPTVHHVLTW